MARGNDLVLIDKVFVSKVACRAKQSLGSPSPVDYSDVNKTKINRMNINQRISFCTCFFILSVVRQVQAQKSGYVHFAACAGLYTACAGLCPAGSGCTMLAQD